MGEGRREERGESERRRRNERERERREKGRDERGDAQGRIRPSPPKPMQYTKTYTKHSHIPTFHTTLVSFFSFRIDGGVAIMMAVQHHNMDMIDVLLKHSADPSIQSLKG
eukprot:1342940-Amorphochlora_amoeboformis.AAC.1